MTGHADAEIEYGLGWSDWVAFYSYGEGRQRLSESGRERFRRLLFWGLVTSLLTLALFGGFAVAIFFLLKLLFWIVSVDDSRWILMGTGILIGLAVVVLAIALPRTYASQSKFMKGRRIKSGVDHLVKAGSIQMGRRYQVSLSPGGLVAKETLHEVRDGTESLEHKDMKVSWGAISAIETTEDHAFVFMAGDKFAIIPARAFPTRQSFLAFVEKVNRFREGSAEEVQPAATDHHMQESTH